MKSIRVWGSGFSDSLTGSELGVSWVFAEELSRFMAVYGEGVKEEGIIHGTRGWSSRGTVVLTSP